MIGAEIGKRLALHLKDKLVNAIFICIKIIHPLKAYSIQVLSILASIGISL